MSKTRLIGDIHGMLNDYKSYSIGYFEGNTIQLGDFGIGMGQSDYWHESVNDFHADGTHRFIRGNHDNPSMCKSEMVGYIPDGYVENDIMFIGGAWSIDHSYRTVGVDWWEDEECSIQEFERFIELYATVKPRVMITHDAPTIVTEHMFIKTGRAIGGSNARSIKTLTGQALELMAQIHQPEFHFFGHWHNTSCSNYNGTTYMCLGELDYIDFDINDSDDIHQSIINKFNI